MARKDEPEPKTVKVEVERPACSNCGAPAEYRETNPGAVPAMFCSACAGKVYPGESWKLEEL